MNTSIISKNITNDLMKYDIIRTFVNLHSLHPRLIKKYQYIPLNFYFFNHKDKYYYHYDPYEGDHPTKKKFDFSNKSMIPVDCKYTIFQDLYLFVGFRKLDHKILPFFFNVRHDPDTIVKNNYFDLTGFTTFDERCQMFNSQIYECINVSQFFKNDFNEIILRTDMGERIPFDTSGIVLSKKYNDFESCFTNILRIVKKQNKK